MDEITVDTLMALRGDAFIRTAYRVLLGRDADENGLVHYRRRLRLGVDRANIIDDLASSAEGRAFAADIPGLAALQRRERWVKMRVVGQVARQLRKKRNLAELHGTDSEYEDTQPLPQHGDLVGGGAVSSDSIESQYGGRQTAEQERRFGLTGGQDGQMERFEHPPMDEITVDTLMALRGDAFIRTAYRVLLGRDADENGLVHYRRRLRLGVDRASIIDDLASSAEGRAFAADIPGLAALQRRERWVKMRVVGQVARQLRKKRNLAELHGTDSEYEDTQPLPQQGDLVGGGAVSVSSDSIESQYLARLMSTMAARQNAEQERRFGLTDGQGGPTEGFDHLVHTLDQDQNGRMKPIEAPDILFPAHFKRLPPRTVALLSALG
ncbi:MAG: DUF4214 domain-containing protein [Sphingobium sp.]